MLDISINNCQVRQYPLAHGVVLSWKVAPSVLISVDNLAAARVRMDGQELQFGGESRIFLQSSDGAEKEP